MALIKDEFDWDNFKPIRELINDLIDIEKDGYTHVYLTTGEYHNDGDGKYYDDKPVLKFKFQCYDDNDLKNE